MPLVEVYKSLTSTTLTSVSFDFRSEPAGFVTQTTFDDDAGENYAIAIDSPTGTSGEFRFALAYQPPPLNDSFANRIKLSGEIISTNATNYAATSEPGEPAHAQNPGGKSVWYSWTAPVSGPVTLSSHGDRFITWAVAYTGSSITNLAHAPGLAVRYNTNTLTTTLSFNAVAFTTYAIVLDGFNNKSGLIGFTLATANSPPAIQSLAIPIGLGGGFKPRITGSPGQKFALQASTNLVNWSDFFSGPFLTNKAEITDTNSSRYNFRFYRALPLP